MPYFCRFGHIYSYVSVRKTILVMYGTYVALRSIMFERSCFLPNIKALQINSPVPLLIVIAEEMLSNHTPSCVHIFLQKCTQEGA